MNSSQLKKNYSTHQKDYQAFQKDVNSFVSGLAEKNSNAIHIVGINQRPANKIKSLGSIISNLKESNKYKKCKTLFDIKDIAGIRVICHCEDDVENFAILLVGELKQKYSFVQRKEIGGKGNEYPYRAVHITFVKIIKLGEKTINLFCEIQLRTVMADAWAVQNHKYLYKKSSEGEAHELTNAVSEIMNGCEKLWGLVKKKSFEKEGVAPSKEILATHKKAESKLELAPKTEDHIQALDKWFTSHKKTAFNGLSDLGIKTFMEVGIRLPDLNLDIAKKVLRDSARNSTIRTFGWPIGIFLDNRPEYSPKVDLKGIHAEISIKEKDWMDQEKERITYDYWAIHSNGAFYLLKSLFEDTRRPGDIFFNTRIVRITEVFLYMKNLYSFFSVPTNSDIEVNIRHGGLKGRVLSSSSRNRELFSEYKINTDEISTTVKTSLDGIESDIVNIIEQYTKSLFEQFEFFELDKNVLEDIVINYVNGKVV